MPDTVIENIDLRPPGARAMPVADTNTPENVTPEATAEELFSQALDGEAKIKVLDVPKDDLAKHIGELSFVDDSLKKELENTFTPENAPAMAALLNKFGQNVANRVLSASLAAIKEQAASIAAASDAANSDARITAHLKQHLVNTHPDAIVAAKALLRGFKQAGVPEANALKSVVSTLNAITQSPSAPMDTGGGYSHAALTRLFGNK